MSLGRSGWLGVFEGFAKLDGEKNNVLCTFGFDVVPRGRVVQIRGLPAGRRFTLLLDVAGERRMRIPGLELVAGETRELSAPPPAAGFSPNPLPVTPSRRIP